MHAAHSIYFQVLGEHGFVALGLFLLFWALVWRMCSQVAALTQDRPDEHWAYWLAQMIKVSLVAYLVGGAFLNLAYWDVPYYLFVAVAVTRSRGATTATDRAGEGRGAAAQAAPVPRGHAASRSAECLNVHGASRQSSGRSPSSRRAKTHPGWWATCSLPRMRIATAPP